MAFHPAGGLHTSISEDGMQVTIGPELPYDLDEVREYVRDLRENYLVDDEATFTVWPGQPVPGRCFRGVTPLTIPRDLPITVSA